MKPKVRAAELNAEPELFQFKSNIRGVFQLDLYCSKAPKIPGKVSYNVCLCSKVDDISRQACLVYVNPISPCRRCAVGFC